MVVQILQPAEQATHTLPDILKPSLHNEQVSVAAELNVKQLARVDVVHAAATVSIIFVVSVQTQSDIASLPVVVTVVEPVGHAVGATSAVPYAVVGQY